MTRCIPKPITALILPWLALMCATERPWPAAAQPAKPGQTNPLYCTFKAMYDAVRAGTMPLVRGCDAARVAGVFREARMPLEVVPPDDAPRFVVTPSSGQNVPSLTVMGQSPAEGQPLPKPPLEVEGVYIQGQKFRAPLISLATITPPQPQPTSTPAPPDLSSLPSRIALSVNSDVSAAKPGDTIAFTVTAREALSRSVPLTYVISDPASCAPPAHQGTPLLLRPKPGLRKIHYHICVDEGDESPRRVIFTVTPTVSDVTLDQSSVSVMVAPAPGATTGSLWERLGSASATVPSSLWWAIGSGAVLLAIWRLKRPDPDEITDTTREMEPDQTHAEWPPISATCALDIGMPTLGRHPPPVLPSASLRVHVGVGRPAVIGPAEETSDG